MITNGCSMHLIRCCYLLSGQGQRHHLPTPFRPVGAYLDQSLRLVGHSISRLGCVSPQFRPQTPLKSPTTPVHWDPATSHMPWRVDAHQLFPWFWGQILFRAARCKQKLPNVDLMLPSIARYSSSAHINVLLWSLKLAVHG